MALFNRNILLKLGGYSTELVGHGWFGLKDYELWLKLTQNGYKARLIPRILSAYRLHFNSMLNTTNLYTLKLNNHPGQKFAQLISLYPNLERYFGFEPDYEGCIDMITLNYIRGWIWNRYQHNTPLLLNIYDYDKLITIVTANKFRLDVFESGKGTGSYRFQFILPTNFRDGKSQLIMVKVAGRSH